MVFAMMALQMSSLGFSPLLPDIQREPGIDYSQVGLFGVYGLVAVAFSIPGAILAKRFSEKNILASRLLVVTAGLALLSRAPNFAFALSSRLVWIIGYRVAFVSVMTAVAVVVPPERRGTAMGILGAMSSLASVVGAPFGIAIGVAFGSRDGILAFAGMALLGSIVFWIFYHPSARPRATAPFSSGRCISRSGRTVTSATASTIRCALSPAASSA